MSKLIILLTFMKGLVFTVAKEPSCPVCSSFDYEQRLLERVLRNELALENLLKEIKETHAKVSVVLSDIDEKRTTLNSALGKAEHDVQKIVQHYRQEINTSFSILNEKVQAAQIVYFRARAPSTFTPAGGQVVVFTRVEVNEGQGYDKVTGKFTALVAGLYMFSVQFCVGTNKWAYLGIIQDDKLLAASAHYGPDNNEECVTFQAFTAVAKGNKVWVKVTSATTELYEQELYRYTSFSGALIRS